MEIGSNFELEASNLRRADDNIFAYLADYNTIYTDSGRSAIRLLGGYMDGVVLLPSYICESVVSPCTGKIEYYKIAPDFSIDLEDLKNKLTDRVTVVYIMHYFGALQPKETLTEIKRLQAELHFVIVEDTTHSIFTSVHTIGDYCICSLRKWFAVPDGAVLYSKHSLDGIGAKAPAQKNVWKRLQAMLLKHAYLYDGVECNRLYRDIFDETEHALDVQSEIYRMSNVSFSLLSCYSVQDMISARRKNFDVLYEGLGGMGLHMVLPHEDIVPLVFPVMTEDRNALRSFLIEKQIYCAVHWPMPEDFTEEVKRSDHMISLPLDQRYGKEHMQYMIRCIKEYRGRGQVEQEEKNLCCNCNQSGIRAAEKDDSCD